MYPATFGSNAACASLTIDGGATMTLPVGVQLDVLGTLALSSGATMTTLGSVDVGGAVFFGDATASWNLGGATHTVGGTWSSAGGGAVGSGWIEFDGNGSTFTKGAAIPNVRISAGTRTVKNTVSAQGLLEIAGDLELTGGTLVVTPSAAGPITLAEVRVGGDVLQAGGTLSMSIEGSGTPSPLLDVAGSYVHTAGAFNTTEPQALIRCGGDFTATAAFAPGQGALVLEGVGTVLTASNLHTLSLEGGASVTCATPIALGGGLYIGSGSTFATGAALDIAGPVSFGDATASWDLGGATHTVGGTWSSAGGGAVGSGWIEFDGNGSTFTQGAPIPNVRISAGTRTVGNTVSVQGLLEVAGDLELTGGTLFVYPNAAGPITLAEVRVGGNVLQAGGTLSMPDDGQNTPPPLVDVAGSFVHTSGAYNVTEPQALIRCGGDFTATAAFAPGQGTVVLEAASTVLDAPSLWSLHVQDGASVTSATPLALGGGLTIFANATLLTTAPLDIAQFVSFDTTASWDLGGATHTVGGTWSSAGGGAVGSGWIEFDGNGSTFTQGAPIPNVRISAGTRTVQNTGSVQGLLEVAGDLELTGGTLFVYPNAAGPITLAEVRVGGNVLQAGGTLSMPDDGQNTPPPLVDVAGSYVHTAGAYNVAEPQALIRCGGDFTATAAFAPGQGTVVLEGASTVLDAPSLWSLHVQDGASVTSATPLALGGGLTIFANATLLTTAPLDIAQFVSFDTTASWDLGGATHNVAGSWFSAGGGAVGSGWIEFDGNGSTFTQGAPIPNVRISAGTRTVGNTVSVQGLLEVAGDLELTGGTLFVYPNAAGPITLAEVRVGGNVLQAGGTLSMPDDGQNTPPPLVDVAGSYVHTAGAYNVTEPQALIRCGGDFTGTPEFAPAQGTLVMTGSAPGQILGAPVLRHVIVPAGKVVIVQGTPTIAGTLSVDGLVQATGTLDVDGALVVAATSALSLVDGPHTFAGTFSCAGKLHSTGEVVFDGAATVTGGPGALFEDLTIDAGAATVAFEQAVALTHGDLRIASGTLQLGAAAGPCRLEVGGSASLERGVLADGHGGSVLDVAGDAVFSGTTTATPPRIECAGNWTASLAFEPASGVVALDGAADSTVSALDPSGEVRFHALEVRNGVRRPARALTLTATSLTVLGGGTLDVAAQALALPASAVAVGDGTLSVGAGGSLALGAATTVDVQSAGTLRVVGSSGTPASVLGHAGGGYALTVDGTLQANHYRFEAMGPAGIAVSAAATLGAFPFDLRSGVFAAPQGGAGAVTLALERSAPTDLWEVAFESCPPGAFNVRVLAGAEVTFVNWLGDCGGEAFEDDPLGLVEWTFVATTVLGSFDAGPGPERVELAWTTLKEGPVDRFVVEWSANPSGGFAVLALVPPHGPGTYRVLHAPVAPDVLCSYRLTERMLDGSLHELASGSAMPWSAAMPANLFSVGPSGKYPEIQSAINAAWETDTIVRVEPGVYPAFVVGAGCPGGLRIVGIGKDPVVIDTTLGPVEIRGRTLGQSVELSRLAIGSATSEFPAVVVNDNAGTVVLDQVELTGGEDRPGLVARGSSAVAVQRSGLLGEPGIRAASSRIVAGRGVLRSIELTAASHVTLGQLAPEALVSADSRLVLLEGLVPDVSAPPFHALDQPIALSLQSAPGAEWFLAVSEELAFHPLPGYEGALLLSPESLSVLATGTSDPTTGLDTFEVQLPMQSGMLGRPLAFQFVQFDATTGVWRYSNVTTSIALPSMEEE